MKKITLLIVLMLIARGTFSQLARVVAECTITYDINIENGIGNASKTLYIKGKKTRSEIESPLFNQTIIYDNKTGEAIVIKIIGSEKYLSRLTAAKWKETNEEWSGLAVTITDETKTILGYPCRRAIAKTKAGKSFSMYYTTGLTASASENPFQFKNIPGLVLEYQAQTAEGKSILFIAKNIDFSPVPASKFILPEGGYREL